LHAVDPDNWYAAPIFVPFTGETAMVKHVLGVVVVAVVLSVLAQFPATAQDSTKLRRVGFLFPGSEEDTRAGLDVLYASFADLGYHAGKSVVFDARYAEGRFERGEELASELLRSGAEVLIAGGYQLSAAAVRVTRTVPIVGVGCGIEHLAASLAHPGGNVTGVTCQSPDLIGKQLQLLSEVAPTEARVGLLLNGNSPSAPTVAQEFERAANSLNLVAHSVAVRRPEEIDPAFDEIERLAVRRVIVMTDSLFYAERRRVVALAASHRVAIIASFRQFPDLGAPFSYGSNVSWLQRRGVALTDKILKGEKPADMPIEQPTRFELVVNLKTTKALGLTIPPALLARADEVIE
jgi:ABC-type uncharacterized transport system substrate-binding protein